MFCICRKQKVFECEMGNRFAAKMKYWKEPSCVYEAAYPFYCILVIFGLVSFSFDGPVRDGKFATKKLNCVYWIFTVSIFVCLLVRGVWKPYTLLSAYEIMAIGLKLAVILSTSSILVVMGYHRSKQSDMQTFMKELHKIDLAVSSDSVQILKTDPIFFPDLENAALL